MKGSTPIKVESKTTQTQMYDLQVSLHKGSFCFSAPTETLFDTASRRPIKAETKTQCNLGITKHPRSKGGRKAN